MTRNCHCAAGERVWAWAWPAVLAGWVLGTVWVVEQVQLWSADFYKFFWLLPLSIIGLFAIGIFANWWAKMGVLLASKPWSAWLIGVTVALLSGCLAVGWAGERALARQAQWLPPAWEGHTLMLQAQVAGLPVRTPLGWRVRLAVEHASVPPATAKAGPERLPEGASPPLAPNSAPKLAHVLVHWMAHPGQPAPRAGETWELAARLKRPHGLANPNGFDAELWMWEQQLSATGSVRFSRQEPWPRRLQPAGWGLDAAREWTRDRLERSLAEWTPPSQAAAGLAEAGAEDGASPPAVDLPLRSRVVAVLTALVVGDQSGIAAAEWEVFRVTGVGHLVSVSGLHITLWAWLMTGLVARLWRWLPTLAPTWGVRVLWWCPAPVAARWGGLALAVAYAAFSGWGVPAQRTVWMLAVWTLLRHSGRQWPGWLVWLTALAVVLGGDPWAWRQAGFWLSFVAVGVLMSMEPPDRVHAPHLGGRVARWCSRLDVVWRNLSTQWRLSLALAPLTLLWFGQFSVVGLLANLVAIPAVTLVITPLALAGVVWPAMWTVAAHAVHVGMQGLAWLATWPWGSVQLPVAPWWLGAWAVCGAWVAVSRWPPGLRLLGVLAVMPVLFWQPMRPLHGEFELLAADVGQGSAVLVRTATGSVLVDAGPRWGPASDAGQRVLVPLLQSLGDVPHAMVLTHIDSDHVGGASALLKTWPSTTVWASFGPAEVPATSHTGPRVQPQPVTTWRACEAGAGWEQDGVQFRFLHPTPDLALPAKDTNNRSCVLRIQGRQSAALLLGDLDARFEAALASRSSPQDLRADWLLAPHHGSRHSSSAGLLQAVQPRWVVVQSGYRNRYGHPAPEVLGRYQAQGLPWRSSPDCGAVFWQSHQPERLRCWRDEQPHHWQPMSLLRVRQQAAAQGHTDPHQEVD